MSKKRKLIDYEENVKLNGNKQNIRVYTYDKNNPVLLFLHGGPGVCDRHWVIHFQKELAKDYTMVLWDQRGAGKSYRFFKTKRGDLHTSMYKEDTAALIEYLCKKFKKDKIVVFGHSWGTVLGTWVSYHHPEHIAAYVGQGQVIDLVRNEEISYNFVMQEAMKAGDKKTIKAIKDHPPVNGAYTDQKAMMAQRDGLGKYGGEEWKNRGGIVQTLLIPILKWNGYGPIEIVKYALGALYQTDVLWGEVIKENFMKEVPELKMPVLLTIGRHDYNTPFELAQEWFDALKAPRKEWAWFEESAHSPIKEEPEAWYAAVKPFLDSLDLK
ncbi:MAG: alpha/beta hydrolase [Clostridia bacterium]|nr:alpha/beta hydrolase [Clostridia bacterium]